MTCHQTPDECEDPSGFCPAHPQGGCPYCGHEPSRHDDEWGCRLPVLVGRFKFQCECELNRDDIRMAQDFIASGGAA